MDLPVGDAPEDTTSMSIGDEARGYSDIGIESCYMNASILYRK
ncbi:unannotated protein [freshwater metagenome]|uniref:Unannotated protein n=1 Tax=freshwater metagenome TaxID=449393 RepID=A0A6J6ETQ0_9ZZZZ